MSLTSRSSSTEQKIKLIEKLCIYFQGATRNMKFHHEDDGSIFNISNLNILNDLFNDLNEKAIEEKVHFVEEG